MLEFLNFLHIDMLIDISDILQVSDLILLYQLRHSTYNLYKYKYALSILF